MPQFAGLLAVQHLFGSGTIPEVASLNTDGSDATFPINQIVIAYPWRSPPTTKLALSSDSQGRGTLQKHQLRRTIGC